MNIGIELNNENKDRLKLLCRDILDDNISRESLKALSKSYLTLLKLEDHEQQTNTQNKTTTIS